MSNLFSALKDEGDGSEDISSDAYDPLAKFSPSFSPQEIMSKYNRVGPPPQELIKSEEYYIRDVIPPESKSFHPPSSEINSTIYLPSGKAQPKQNQQQSRGRGINSKQIPSPKNKFRGNLKINETQQEDVSDDPSQMWYYKDPVDHVVGPYPSKKMREWFERRYIDQNLFVKCAASDCPYQPISVLFPDITHAFSERNVKIPLKNDEREGHTTLISFSNDEKDEDIMNLEFEGVGF